MAYFVQGGGLRQSAVTYAPYGNVPFYGNQQFVGQPLTSSFVRPLQQSLAIPFAQPQFQNYGPPQYNYAPNQSFAPAQSQAPKQESRTEYIPYEKQVIEYETQQIEVQVPKTKTVTDFYPVEVQTDYVPYVTYEKETEYIPYEKYVPKVEYQAVERQVQQQPPQQVYYQQQQPVQYLQPSYVAPLTQSFVQPQLYGSRVPAVQYSGYRGSPFQAYPYQGYGYGQRYF